MRNARNQLRGFTLVELLVVIGILAMLIAMLLSAVHAARRQANMIVCAANLGNLAKVLLAYGSDQRAFPPNSSSASIWWSDEAVLGQYATYSYNASTGASHKGLVCGEDEGSVRSYAMNFWASSMVDASLAELSPTYGEFWKPTSGPSAQLLLAVESYSSSTVGPGWNYAPAVVGQRGDLPGQRFGMQGGVPLLRLPTRISVNTQLQWRHGLRQQPKINLAFADGHVKSFTQAELANADGSLTGEAFWTPVDK